MHTVCCCSTVPAMPPRRVGGECVASTVVADAHARGRERERAVDGRRGEAETERNRQAEQRQAAVRDDLGLLEGDGVDRHAAQTPPRSRRSAASGTSSVTVNAVVGFDRSSGTPSATKVSVARERSDGIVLDATPGRGRDRRRSPAAAPSRRRARRRRACRRARSSTSARLTGDQVLRVAAHEHVDRRRAPTTTSTTEAAEHPGPHPAASPGHGRAARRVAALVTVTSAPGRTRRAGRARCAAPGRSRR